MTNVIFANRDYRSHMSNEGEQFQVGLIQAGWTPVGVGYDGLQSTREILNRYKPEVVVVHDKRDWDPRSPISFDKEIGFTDLHHLAGYDGMVFVVVKDAGSMVKYHQQFIKETDASAAITYYHPRSVRLASQGMLNEIPLIRTYHSVNRQVVHRIKLRRERGRCIVTGAGGGNSRIYPLRCCVRSCKQSIRVDDFSHPGYSNRKCSTGDYLEILSLYKTHIATASSFGFALRKIIESVAVGTTPITNLPEYDILPEIDDALVRVQTDIRPEELRDVVDEAEEKWDLDERLAWSEKACGFYDYIELGRKLSRLLTLRARTELASDQIKS